VLELPFFLFFLKSFNHLLGLIVLIEGLSYEGLINLVNLIPVYAHFLSWREKIELWNVSNEALGEFSWLERDFICRRNFLTFFQSLLKLLKDEDNPLFIISLRLIFLFHECTIVRWRWRGVVKIIGILDLLQLAHIVSPTHNNILPFLGQVNSCIQEISGSIPRGRTALISTIALTRKSYYPGL